MALKRHMPDIRFSGNLVTPDEIDRYEVYNILGPMMGTFAWGTITGTNGQTKAIVFDQVLPDYPRNIEVKHNTASGSTGGGVTTVIGKDQFGNTISETFTNAVAANGGTAVGTKIFAKFTAATCVIGASNAGAQTITVYPASTGTTALFGLPTKIGGSTDVKMMTFGSTGVAKPVNGGTLGAFVDTTNHAIKAPNTITTPAADLTWITVWYKSSYAAEEDATMSNL